LLVGIGFTQVRQHQSSQARPPTIEQFIGQHVAAGSPFSRSLNASESSTVPAVSVLYFLFGYLLQVLGCALYADNRGRSAFFGLLGLLSPIGYVLLSLLSPSSSRVANANATNAS
jgi:hypothetical protein